MPDEPKTDETPTPTQAEADEMKENLGVPKSERGAKRKKRADDDDTPEARAAAKKKADDEAKAKQASSYPNRSL